MHMLRKTPLAAAIMSFVAVPVAAPLYAHAQAAPASQVGQTAQADKATAPAENATLPAVQVSGQADTSTDFQPEKSSVGAKVPTALRDIPQAAVVVPKAVLQSQAA